MRSSTTVLQQLAAKVSFLKGGGGYEPRPRHEQYFPKFNLFMLLILRIYSLKSREMDNFYQYFYIMPKVENARTWAFSTALGIKIGMIKK
jgi:hypothetical protein